MPLRLGILLFLLTPPRRSPRASPPGQVWYSHHARTLVEVVGAGDCATIKADLNAQNEYAVDDVKASAGGPAAFARLPAAHRNEFLRLAYGAAPKVVGDEALSGTCVAYAAEWDPGDGSEAFFFARLASPDEFVRAHTRLDNGD